MSGPYRPDGDCRFCHRPDCDNGDNPCNERQALTVHECYRCEKEFDHTPVIDDTEALYVVNPRTWCSIDCLTSDAEDDYARRYEG